jgi:hypothetical protein
MVADTGKTPRPSTFKPVNAPEALRIEENPAGHPVALIAKTRQAVVAIESIWRLDDEWWRARPLSRMYFAVMLTSGQGLVIFKDLVDNRWFRQNY